LSQKANRNVLKAIIFFEVFVVFCFQAIRAAGNGRSPFGRRVVIEIFLRNLQSPPKSNLKDLKDR
jgi:hypothetical protein